MGRYQGGVQEGKVHDQDFHELSHGYQGECGVYLPVVVGVVVILAIHHALSSQGQAGRDFLKIRREILQPEDSKDLQAGLSQG